MGVSEGGGIGCRVLLGLEEEGEGFAGAACGLFLWVGGCDGEMRGETVDGMFVYLLCSIHTHTHTTTYTHTQLPQAQSLGPSCHRVGGASSSHGVI